MGLAAFNRMRKNLAEAKKVEAIKAPEEEIAPEEKPVEVEPEINTGDMPTEEPKVEASEEPVEEAKTEGNARRNSRKK